MLVMNPPRLGVHGGRDVITFLGCPVPGLPIGLFECRNHVLGSSAMLFC